MTFNKIKVLFLSCAIFVLIDCQPEAPDREKTIYTRDMMYACEGQSYRVFRVVDKSSDPESIAVLSANFDEPRTEQDKVLKKEYEAVSALEYEPKANLIGLDVLPVFGNDETEQQFLSEIESSPFCYIYLFTGSFKGKQRFLVRSCQVIPVSQKCIKESGVEVMQGI